ncbi:MAG: GxxExxY protein [Lentimicrobiaceae bacterium]|nr:GxxExxY protein [Lentimicrobiaceae bacterium]
MEKYKYKELTDKIIQAFYCVYNELGFGFLFNFGMKPGIRRKAFNNDRKNNLRKS